MIAQAGSGQLNKESRQRSELRIRWMVINEETDTTCTNKHLNHARRSDSVSSKSKALSFNLNILTPSYAEHVSVLGASPEAELPHGWAAGPAPLPTPGTAHTANNLGFAAFLSRAGLLWLCLKTRSSTKVTNHNKSKSQKSWAGDVRLFPLHLLGSCFQDN